MAENRDESEKSMKVNYFCPFAQRHGVARAAHDYCMSLLSAGVDLTIVPIFGCDTDDLDPLYEPLLEHATDVWPDSSEDAYWVVHAMPADAFDLDRMIGDDATHPRILITTWETRDVPPDWATRIRMGREFDHLIVPSEHCAEAFGLSKWASCGPVATVVPHAAHAIWGMEYPPTPTTNENGPYKFYTIGAWGTRKNILGLIAAYLSEFGPSEDVELVIKTDMVDEVSLASLKRGTNLDQFPKLVFDSGRATSATAFGQSSSRDTRDTTYYLSEYRSQTSLVAFHLAHDCFVTATRGEGWHLPLFEACFLGKRVIATHFGGHLDYLLTMPRDENVETIDYVFTPAIWTESLKPMRVAMGGMEHVMQQAVGSVPRGVDAKQMWAEPNLYHLRKAMRRAYASWAAKRLTRGQHGPRLDHSRYSYETVGKQLVDAIKKAAK